MRTGWMAVRERVFLVAGVAQHAGPGGVPVRRSVVVSCALTTVSVRKAFQRGAEIMLAHYR